MKKTLILTGIIAISVLTLAACKSNSDNQSQAAAAKADSLFSILEPGSFAYFNLDRTVEEYDFAKDKKSEVEAKVEGIQKEVNRRQKSLENAVKDYQTKASKGLMTSAVAMETEKKLQKQNEAFQQFAQQKQNEILEEQQVMMNQILDAIKTYVDDMNLEKGFAMIFVNNGGAPVFSADPTLDITDAVISGLNAKYLVDKESLKEEE